MQLDYMSSDFAPVGPMGLPRFLEVLILDDCLLDRRRIKRDLGKTGAYFNVTEVSSLREMRNAVAQKRFDIAFIDHYLTDGDSGCGIEALRSTSHNAETMAILVTGMSSPCLEATAVSLGFDDVYDKRCFDACIASSLISSRHFASTSRLHYAEEADPAAEPMFSIVEEF